MLGTYVGREWREKGGGSKIVPIVLVIIRTDIKLSEPAYKVKILGGK